jgi:hypothetical protein
VTSIRRQLADKVKAEAVAQALGLDVYPFGIDPQELGRPAVAVFRETVDAGAQATSLGHGFIIQIFSPHGHATEAAEDALDSVLDVVLLALQRLAVVAFRKAERKVFLERFQGWEIEATWESENFYRNQV